VFEVEVGGISLGEYGHNGIIVIMVLLDTFFWLCIYKDIHLQTKTTYIANKGRR
jgi:hypothetical protein